MKYGFYSTNDSKREIIHSGVFQSSHDAAAFFAALKGLDINTFLQLFIITTVTR